MTRGKKPKPPAERKSAVLQVPVTKAYRKAVEYAAAASGLTVAEFVRHAIEATDGFAGYLFAAGGPPPSQPKPDPTGRYLTFRIVGPRRSGMDTGKRYKAVVHTRDGAKILVHSSSASNQSHYGFQLWMDSRGNNYGQIDLVNSKYEVDCIEEITEQEAQEWEKRNGLY